MGVAKHHHIHTREVRRDLFPVVDHGKSHAVQGNGEVMGDVLRPLLVVVSPDDVEGCVLLQGIHDARFIDVTTVKNDVGGFQILLHLRPQQPMRVGKNGKFHGVSSPRGPMLRIRSRSPLHRASRLRKIFSASQSHHRSSRRYSVRSR